ncbi:MAG: MBL fold metallo-hydrolase, partial [Candidatus Absconditabacteria bacterium]
MKKSLSSLSSLSVTLIGGVGTPNKRDFSGSMSLVTIKRTSGQLYNILVDCGLSHRGESFNYINFISPKAIDLILLTHAHIDHIGMLPYIGDKNNGFKGRIIASKETLKLSNIMLNDSVSVLGKHKNNTNNISKNNEMNNYNSLIINLKEELSLIVSSLSNPLIGSVKSRLLNREKQMLEKEIEYISNNSGIFGNKGSRVDELVFYSSSNIEDLFNGKNIYSLDSGELFEVVDGVSISLVNSAHILGSSQFLIKVDDGNGGNVNLGFSGDVGRYSDNNIGSPQIFDEKLDFYMIESTYGSRVHENQFDQLIRFIEDVGNLGGKIFIPVFMLQRFQDVALKLINMQKKLKYDT